MWKTVVAIVVSASVMGGLVGGLVGMAQSPARSVWDGAFTDAQALRGMEAYDVSCASCHQADLSGGVLVGDDEAPALRNVDRLAARKDLDALFSFVKNGMPADSPSSLTDATYIDIVAYILQQNAFPAGHTELKADPGTLKTIAIVRTRP